MPEHKGFAEFVSRFGDADGIEVMERIADAHWNNGGSGVTFSDIYQHNACNHTLSGTIEHRGETFGFVIESGDRNGTLIHQWGNPEDVTLFEPPTPLMYTFVPQDDCLTERRPELYQVYLAWTKEDWFQEKVRSYNYDRHFQPGGATEKHYRDWAAMRGMKPAPEVKP